MMLKKNKKEKDDVYKKKSWKLVVLFVCISIMVIIGSNMLIYFLQQKDILTQLSELIVAVVWMIVVLFLTILIHHAVVGQSDKLWCYILIVLCILIITYHYVGVGEERNIEPQNVVLTNKMCKDYKVIGNRFQSMVSDPQIEIDMKVEQLENIVIHFSTPIKRQINVQVFYTTYNSQQYGGDKVVVLNLSEGTTESVVTVQAEKVEKIRVDIGDTRKEVFDLDSIEINGNYEGRIASKVTEMMTLVLWLLLAPAIYFLFLLFDFLSERGREKKKWKWIRRFTMPYGFLTVFTLFLSLVLIALVDWLKTTCGEVSFSIIVLQLSTPLKGADEGIVYSILQAGLLIPFVETASIVIIYHLIIRAMYQTGDLKEKRMPLLGKFVLEIAGILLLCITVSNQGKRVGMWDYVSSMMQTSTLYEEYYTDPAETEITFPKTKRNLVYIYMESMESSFTDKKQGGTMEDDYIPYLTNLAEDNLQFTDKKNGKLGGGICLESTGFTVGGLVAQTSGVHLKTINTGAMFGKFLPNLTTLGDVLEKQGYQQVFLCGSDGDFAGRDAYFKDHGNYTIEDYYAAINEGYIPEDYFVYWGHEDEILYKRAKDQLKVLASDDEPFNLTMLTVDTHFPTGFVCSLCGNKYNEQYANVIHCADTQVYDFVKWIQKQSFYEDTTIIISGDHVSMTDESDYFWKSLDENYTRTVYNVFINADKRIQKKQTEERTFSTMDMFPTTLSALGAKIDGDRLGLGTDLFSGTPTLCEQLGVEYLNEELGKNDKAYNAFY